MKHLSNNDFNDNLLTNVPDGVSPQDAINRRQLDSKTGKLSADITITVGSGGDYATINQAIEALSESYPTYKNDGFLAEIRLLAGFVMAEQVFAVGVDLSWITLTSVDAVVQIDHNAINTAFIQEDSNAPVFGAKNDAKMLTIGVQFEYSNNTTAKDGVTVAFNSSVRFLPETGIRNCRHGIKVLYNSSASCYIPGLTIGGGGANAGTTTGVDFSGTLGRSLQVSFNSTAGLARSNFDNNEGSYGVYVIWNSNADIYQSTIKNAGQTAVNCRDGSTVNARATDVSGAGLHGYHALHNARINARYEEGTTWGVGGARFCGGNGVFASNNSFIDAVDTLAHNCGAAGISALENSMINASFVNASYAGEHGVFARAGSVVNFKEGIANDCTGSAAIYAQGASSIDATGAIARRNPGRAVLASAASNIALDGAQITHTQGDAIVAEKGSTISAVGANAASGTGTAFTVLQGSTIAANSSTGGSFSKPTNAITGSGIIYTNNPT